MYKYNVLEFIYCILIYFVALHFIFLYQILWYYIVKYIVIWIYTCMNACIHRNKYTYMNTWCQCLIFQLTESRATLYRSSKKPSSLNTYRLGYMHFDRNLSCFAKRVVNQELVGAGLRKYNLAAGIETIRFPTAVNAQVYNK